MRGSSRRDGERRWSLLPWPSTGNDCGDQSSDPSRSWRGAAGHLRRVVTATAFWLAISLPFLYLPILFSGLDTRSESLVFGALLVGHVATLSLGHPYATDRPTDRGRDTTADRSETAD